MWTWPQYHICESCNQYIADAEKEDDNVTCLAPYIEIDGHQYRRSKYPFDEGGRRCHDCQVKHGGIHHTDCDVEICPCDDCGFDPCICDYIIELDPNTG